MFILVALLPADIPMRRLIASALAALLLTPSLMHAQRYTGSDGRLRVALVKQPYSPTGTSAGPNTMANGGIQQVLAGLGAVVRVEEAALTPDEPPSMGGWKLLGMRSRHFADMVAKNERDVTSPSVCWRPVHRCLGLVAGLQHPVQRSEAAQNRNALARRAPGLQHT